MSPHCVPETPASCSHVSYRDNSHTSARSTERCLGLPGKQKGAVAPGTTFDVTPDKRNHAKRVFGILMDQNGYFE